MGKEWLHWVIGGGGGGKGRSSARRGRKDKMEEEAADTSAGCMCAVLQIFDLNHFQIPLNQQHSSGFDASFLQEDTTTIKGVEAPRNSLELDVPSIKVGSMSLCKKEEESLNFPVGINHIKTRHEKISSPRISTKSRIDDISSECSSTYSPGTKTPTLVARLMGLDLLPESTPSPSFSSSNSKPKQKDKNTLRIRSNRGFSDDDISVGARSLPETPRISSARRSDVEYPRLSLQINKENVLNEELSNKRGSRFRVQDENKSSSSPRHFAKQIVSQVKESLSRRVGLSDITNTNNRRDENLILLNPTKKNPKVLSNCEIIPITEPSCSPKLRFLETNKNKPLPINSNTKIPKITVKSEEITIPLKSSKKFVSGKSNLSSLKKLPHQATDHAIRNKKEDLFANNVEKKPKKTPLISNEIVNISGPTILPVKKDPSPPATKLPQKQSHGPDALSSKRSTQLLSCNSNHPYKQLQLHSNIIFTIPENVVSNGCATTSSGGALTEYENYIQRILKRTGITDRATPLTLAKWHTLSHPLDPSIFHYLELFHPSAGGSGRSILSSRCNRKLIFQLVDEILAEILKPHLDFKPWVTPITINHHFAVVDELCKKILNFPAKNCQVLEDIDALIDTDLCRLKSKELVVEEWERIVCGIEGEIFESLLRETVAVTVGVGGRTKIRGDSSTWASFT